MVKLFVGNLADSVDSHRLRNLFLQYVQVQECDVLKNFAFVHVVSEEDAELCIQKLHKTMFENRELHLERSTSKLRKEPGMSDKCFTCGATDHKTPNCPQELVRRQKRGLDGSDDGLMGPEGKKPSILPTINLASGSMPALGQSSSIPSWQCKVGGGNDADPELPCPTNPELQTLYNQYMEARTKYFFYRERLSKELALQPTAAPVHMRFDMTRGQPQQVQMAGKPQMLMQQPTPMLSGSQLTASAPALQYSASPANYQPSSLQQTVYSSTPLSSIPASAYASRPQVTASQQPQMLQQSSVASSIYPGQQQNLAPAAPYNTMVRQPASATYATYPLAPQPPNIQSQNGHQQPSAPYSNAPYRNPPYSSSAHYNTVPTGPR